MTVPELPACPPWCAGLHAHRVPQFHVGDAIRPVYVTGNRDGDALGAFPAQRDGEAPCVLITGRTGGRNEPDATFSREQAEAVARVVELLATAGPEAHRKLAAAIRRAAEIISREDRS